MLWHIPLTIQGDPNERVPLWWYPIVTVVASVTYTAMFNMTGVPFSSPRSSTGR